MSKGFVIKTTAKNLMNDVRKAWFETFENPHRDCLNIDIELDSFQDNPMVICWDCITKNQAFGETSDF